MKNAFTLAEVLITLAIIGVVAAITAPALNNAIQKNKVGPTLRKFVSTIENANEHMLGENDEISIYSLANDIESYYVQLKNYVEGSYDMTKSASDNIKTYAGTVKNKTASYTTESDGIFTLKDGSQFVMGNYELGKNATASTSFKGAVAGIIFDINGFDKKPNRYGKDIFEFILDNGGALIPYGGETYTKVYDSENEDQNPLWKATEGNNGCSDVGKVISGTTCAGSIADNSWKVIYKY